MGSKEGVSGRLREPDLKPGLHIVVIIAEHVCDYVLKSALKLLTYKLQIFLVKSLANYLQLLQLFRNETIPGQPKKRVRKHVPAILMTCMDTRLNNKGFI